MKKIFALSLSLILVLGFIACSHEPETEIRYFLTEAIFERGGEIQKTTYAYDENWWLIETASFLNGAEEFRAVTAYDEQGHEISTTMYTGEEIASVIETHNTYDKNGNLIRIETVQNGEVTITQEMTYDSEGNRLTLKQENSGSGYETEQTFRTDGKLISSKTITIFPDIGSVESTVTNTYDAKGRIIESINTYNSGAGINKTISEYGSGGELAKEIIYDDLTGEAQYYNAYSYDGNVETVTQHMADGDLVSTSVRTYDDTGNLIKNEYYDQNGKLLQTMRYTYVAAE